MSKSTPLSLHELQSAVGGSAAAFRFRRRLQPAGGAGDKVFPPTFAGPPEFRYAREQRRVIGRSEPAMCVLLDSVQSQANRMEAALQEAVDVKRLKLPLLVVDFSASAPTGDVEADTKAGRLIDDVGRITSLQVPHRLADAILRDSDLNGVSFRKSEKGRTLNKVSVANATPLFELCPTALVFGMWDSTGPKGGLGPKFERAMVSEVVGVGAEIHDFQKARGVRRDPLEVRAAVKVLKAADKSWSGPDPKAKGATEPSKINHSSVPFDSDNSGVTIEYAEQTTTLSLICLRRLRFPKGVENDAKRDQAARTVLAALGLCAATLAFEAGMGLRSRCLLWPEAELEWELLEKPGSEAKRFALDGDQAVALLQEAVDAAVALGLPWPTEPLVLTPSAELLKLVRLSQQEATKESADAQP